MGQQKEGKAVVAWRVIHRDGWRLPKLNQIASKMKRDLIAGNCSSEPAMNLGLLRRVCMDEGERFTVGVVAGL